VSFQLSRRQVKTLGSPDTMEVFIYAYQSDSRLLCSSVEELFVRRAEKKKGKASSSLLPTPDDNRVVVPPSERRR
jgi:hypothetical protein